MLTDDVTFYTFIQGTGGKTKLTNTLKKITFLSFNIVGDILDIVSNN